MGPLRILLMLIEYTKRLYTATVQGLLKLYPDDSLIALYQLFMMQQSFEHNPNTIIAGFYKQALKSFLDGVINDRLAEDGIPYHQVPSLALV